jgi:hypothetical protein
MADRKTMPREDVRSMNSAAEVALRRWLAERRNEKGPHVAAP